MTQFTITGPVRTGLTLNAGDSLVLTPAGSIGAAAPVLGTGANITLDIAGRLTAPTDGTITVRGDNADVTIRAGAVVTARGLPPDGAVAVENTVAMVLVGENLEFTNAGRIIGAGGVHVSGGYIDAEPALIVNSGVILGRGDAFAQNAGLTLSLQSSRIENSGEIRGQEAALILRPGLPPRPGSGHVIENSGRMSGLTGLDLDTDAPVRVVNDGTIAGLGGVAIRNAGARLDLVNAGVLAGGIAGGAGREIVTNLGHVDGDIRLGGGADRLVLGRAATVAGRIDGGAGADRLTGGAARDRIDGGAGADRIDGGAGADTLRGGAGRDLIVAGGGWDWLEGGAGADTFVLGPGSHVVRIADFAPGRDRIDLSFAGIDAGELLDAALGGTAAGARLDLGEWGGGVLRLDGVAAASLTAEDFIL